MRDDELNTCAPMGEDTPGCKHYAPGRCRNPLHAKLAIKPVQFVEVGHDLATLPQRCLGYAPRTGK